MRRVGGVGACLLLTSVAPGVAQQKVADAQSAAEAATFLLVPIGARAVGMAGAVAASKDQFESVFWNPAGIGSLERGSAYFMHSNDFGTDSNVAGLVWRFGVLRAGFAYYAFDLGSLEATDGTGASLGSLDVGNREFVLTGALPVVSGLDLGANVKLVQFASSCSGLCGSFDFTSSTVLFDLGALFTPPGFDALSVAGVLANAGPGMDLNDSGVTDPAPTRLRLGVAVDLLDAVDRERSEEAAIDLAIEADVQEPWLEFDDLQLFLGGEVGIVKIVYVRTGYAWAGDGRSGAALGFGVHYKRLRLNLGRSFDDFSSFDTDEPFQFSIGLDI